MNKNKSNKKSIESGDKKIKRIFEERYHNILKMNPKPRIPKNSHIISSSCLSNNLSFNHKSKK